MIPVEACFTIHPHADHIWVERCIQPALTEGGIVMPTSARKERALQYGIVYAIGPDAKLEKDKMDDGIVVFFDQGESREVFIDSTHGKIAFVVIPDECIYGWMTYDCAKDLNLSLQVDDS